MDIFRSFLLPCLTGLTPSLYWLGAIRESPRPLGFNLLFWHQSAKKLVIRDVKCFFGFGQLYRVKGHNLHPLEQQ